MASEKLDKRWIDLLERVYPNPKTRANYNSRLISLQRALNISLLEILKNPEIHYQQIQKKYTSLTTRKNILTVILVLFREDKELHENKSAYERWKKLHDDLGRLQQAKVRRSEPEDKQVEKYTSFEEIESKYEELKRRGFHDTLRHSMQFTLLSVITHIRPKRADLGAVEIYRDDDPRKTDQNYIVLRKPKDGGSYLVMNMYKTSKYYQTVEEDIPEGLVRDIEQSLTRHPRKYLFTKEKGDPMSNNTYSVFVRQTFEEIFGRSTGVSLLRHIYITEKLDFDDMTIEERNAEAKLMLHTSGVQQQYKWPKKVICPKLCAAYIKQTHKTRKIKRSRSLKVHPTV
jgi:hypothetical protein